MLELSPFGIGRPRRRAELEGAMKIQSARFGELEVPEQSVIHFPDGIIPFGENLDFALLPGSGRSSAAWLQSLQYPELAFWAGHAAGLFPERDIGIEAHHLRLMQIRRPEQLSILLILTVQEHEVTANLLAPVLINVERRLGRQVVLTDSLERVHVLVPAERVVEQPA